MKRVGIRAIDHLEIKASWLKFENKLSIGNG